MNKSYQSLFSAIFSGILMSSNPRNVGAFDSWEHLGHKNVHGAITRKAFVETEVRKYFSADAVERIIEANSNQDYNEADVKLKPGVNWIVPNKNYRPAHHFDRNVGISHKEAFGGGRKYLRFEGDKVEGLLVEGKTGDAIDAIGHILHALQDFFSHSNFVSLSHSDQLQCIEALFDETMKKSPSPALLITGYDRTTGRDNPDDGYGHDAHCKDNPDKNADAKKLVTFYPLFPAPTSREKQVTAFTAAFDDAVTASSFMVQVILHSTHSAKRSRDQNARIEQSLRDYKK